MNLSRDVTRCLGKACRVKNRCARHTQLERDKDMESDRILQMDHCRDDWGIELMFIPEDINQ